MLSRGKSLFPRRSERSQARCVEVTQPVRFAREKVLESALERAEKSVDNGPVAVGALMEKRKPRSGR